MTLAYTQTEVNIGDDGDTGVNIVVPEIVFNVSPITVNNSIFWDGNAFDLDRWLLIDGSNANQNINISPFNLTVNSLFASNSSIFVGGVKISSFEDTLQIEDGKTLNASFLAGDGFNIFNLSLNFSNGSAFFFNITADNYIGGNYTGDNFFSSMSY